MLVAEVAAAAGAESADDAEAAPELAPPSKMLVGGAVEAALLVLAPNIKIPPELGSATSVMEPLAPPKMLPELLGAESKMLAAGFGSPSEAGFAALKRPERSVPVELELGALSKRLVPAKTPPDEAPPVAPKIPPVEEAPSHLDVSLASSSSKALSLKHAPSSSALSSSSPRVAHITLGSNS